MNIVSRVALERSGIALAIAESLKMGDHLFLRMLSRRAAFGFACLFGASIANAFKDPKVELSKADIALIVANPAAHGVRLAQAVQNGFNGLNSVTISDQRFAEPSFTIDGSFPGISPRSLFPFVTIGRLVNAARWRSQISLKQTSNQLNSKFYAEYLFLAQAVRFQLALASIRSLADTALILSDYDRHTYCQPWIWAANFTGRRSATLVHGSPSVENYLPLLASRVFVWGETQLKWFENLAPDAEVVVVGRPELAASTSADSGRVPATRVVICHSREKLSAWEVATILATIKSLQNQGLRSHLRLHPSAKSEDLDVDWSAIASRVDSLGIGRGDFVQSLEDGDVVIVVSSSAAIEASLRGIPVLVLADESRDLPCDLEAMRSHSIATLTDFDPADRLIPSELSEQIVALVGADSAEAIRAAVTSTVARS